MKVTFKKMMMLCLFIMTLFATNVANAQELVFNPSDVELEEGEEVYVTVEIPDGYEDFQLDYSNTDLSVADVSIEENNSRAGYGIVRIKVVGRRGGSTTITGGVIPVGGGKRIFGFLNIVIRLRKN